jgi:D-alanine-D-alanine ligase
MKVMPKSKIRTGVLRGGPSSEYDVSLKTGAAVLEHLPRDRYEPIDVFIDKRGVWHQRGRPIDPSRALSHLDTAFLALHGEYGEDGTVQRMLESHGVPFTGSKSMPSALAMNKMLAKERMKAHGIKTPFARVVHSVTVSPLLIHELFRSFPQPAVIKPLASGSSVGVTIASSFPEFERGIWAASEVSDRIMLEEYVRGTEVTCGVVESFRGEKLYSLPEIEIVPHNGRTFFDYDAKYNGASHEICPGRFTPETKQQIAHLAKSVHNALDLRHYSRSDFIVNKHGIHFLEVNTLPGLTPASLVPQAVAAVGASFSEFLHHLVQLSLQRA